ncbi:MAG: filamentous hemagglutinin family protein, partial [Verrucomicrobiota bacterium]
VMNLAPPSLSAVAFSGDINAVGNLILAPAARGNLKLLAGGAISGLQAAGKTEFQDELGNVSALEGWISSTINLSDADPGFLPQVQQPLSYYGFAGEEGVLYESAPNFLTALDEALIESGSCVGNDASVDIKRKRHKDSLLHAGDLEPVQIYATSGSLSGFNVFTPKSARIAASGDITDVALHIQNLKVTDVSIVSAGGDILPYNESSALRSRASDRTAGNVVLDSPRTTASNRQTTTLSGDIQVNGPGFLEVLAGRNLDLGTGENLIDGTGTGITSIGNSRNPGLPFEGASIIAMAGIQSQDGGPALGLSESRLSLDGLRGMAGGITPEIPLSEDSEHIAIAGLQTLFALIKKTGEDYPTSGVYEPALTAVQTTFAKIAVRGDLFTRSRDIRTVSGGAITLAAPRGSLTMSSDIFGNPLTPPGIVTEYGGGVSILTEGDVEIGRARIFTLRGGDMTIWSSRGDIAAGTSPKTVVTAPPTRVLVDAPSADVKTDLGGLATGGGIGVLAAVENVEPGNVYLLAPVGTVDAGDAGIQSTGNLNIAAVSVLNADNISTGGTTAGVPATAPAAAAPVSVSPSASSSTAAASSAAQSMTARSQDQKEPQETPSIITVEILGYGGGDGDREEDDEKKSAML